MQNIKKQIKKAGVLWRKFFYGTLYFMMTLSAQMTPLMVYAADKKSGAEAIKTSLNSFYTIVSAFVSAVGSIILLWGVFEWGSSMQSNDGTMQNNAFKRIGGGLVMIIAPQIISGFIN